VIRSRRAALVVLVVVAGAGVFADCIADDRPLLVSRGGDLIALPNLRDIGPTGDALRAELADDDWAIWPPIDRDPIEVRTGGRLAVLSPPSSDHVLGTDDRGRDVAARLVHGARTTTVLAVAAAAVALALALALALAAALGGRVVDTAMRTVCDAIAGVPPIVTVIAVQGLVDARGVGAVVWLIAIPRAADTARLARAAIRRALAEPWADAVRSTGASRTRLVIRHALPHAVPVLAVASAATAATAVLSEAALTILGAGVPSPTPSWGELLAQATANDLRWWLSVPAGLAITVTAWALLALATSPSRRT
jgi:peptide/nickel transport system permease protein